VQYSRGLHIAIRSIIRRASPMTCSGKVTTHDRRYFTQSYIDTYAGLWAFGYVNRFGQAEGMYRTVASLAFERLSGDQCSLVLDFGCGVGRMAAMMARFYRDAQVIGVDDSPLMIDMANKIVCDTGEPVTLDLSDVGFRELTLPRLGIRNVEFLCETGEAFARQWMTSTDSRFDIIVAANVLDRVASPAAAIGILHDLLAPRGIVVGSSPLNFALAEQWASMSSASDLALSFEEAGFVVEFLVDGLVYREVLDARGSSADYCSCVFMLRSR
jgi:SAM-dependent methyltransferase